MLNPRLPCEDSHRAGGPRRAAALLLLTALVLSPISTAAASPAEDDGRTRQERLRQAAAASAGGDHDEAVRLYQLLNMERPGDPEALFGLAGALTATRQHDEAEAIYEDLMQRRVQPIRAHVGMAELFIAQGALAEAERLFRNVLQADGDNLRARIGLARVKHLQGNHRAAREQTNNIVYDRPESDEARALQRDIRLAIRPHADLDGARFDDGDGGRVDSATAAYTFRAEPQTTIRIGLTGYKSEFRCVDRSLCDEVPGAGPVDELLSVDAQTLTGGLTSRIISSIDFHARLGAVREESFDGEDRTVLIGGGFIRWRVGPRLSLDASASREAMTDTAKLIDRGLRLDSADLQLDYRFHPAWVLSGHADYGSYSDGNARETAHIALEWSRSGDRFRIAGIFDAWYRRFHDDRDNGYFDPIRYDSERLRFEAEGDGPGPAVFWRLNGMFGIQEFDRDTSSRVEGTRDDTIRSIEGAIGVKFGSRGRLEAFYVASDDPLRYATGFDSRRYGFSFRLWI